MKVVSAICFIFLFVAAVYAQDSLPAPPFAACHASAKVKGAPTCGDNSDPIVACQPNECILRVYELAPASSYVYKDNPPCGDDVSKYTKDAVEKAVALYTDNPMIKEEVVGRVAGPLTGAVSQLLSKTDGMGDIGKYLISPYSNQNSVCVPIVAAIPRGSKLTRYMLAAADTDQDPSNGVGRCPQDAVCQPRAWSAFENFELSSASADGPTVASVVFKNWRNDKNRRAVMVLWFTPPPSGRLTLQTGQ